MENYDVCNGLMIKIDWLSFTILDDLNLKECLGLFGFSEADFVELPKGANGYKSMMKMHEYDIKVLYDGKSDMGIHFDVTGSAISYFLERFVKTLETDTPYGKAYAVEDFNASFMRMLFETVLKHGQFSRVDIALDDFYAKFYTVLDIVDMFNSGRVISKWKSWKHVYETKNSDNSLLGNTVYCGSRQSDIYLRIYDKQLEQSKGNDKIEIPWVRWELEFKGERVNELADKFVAMDSLSGVFLGVLNNYFRIIDLDDSNKSRCSTNEKWLSFIGEIERLTLYVSKPERTISEKKDWLNKCVAPTLSACFIADGGDMDFIYSMLKNGSVRMKQPLREQVMRENPAYFGV